MTVIKENYVTNIEMRDQLLIYPSVTVNNVAFSGRFTHSPAQWRRRQSTGIAEEFEEARYVEFVVIIVKHLNVLPNNPAGTGRWPPYERDWGNAFYLQLVEQNRNELVWEMEDTGVEGIFGVLEGVRIKQTADWPTGDTILYGSATNWTSTEIDNAMDYFATDYMIMGRAEIHGDPYNFDWFNDFPITP